MTGSANLRTLIIAEKESLAASVQRVIKQILGNTAAVSALTYSESLTFLTPACIAETDLFVIDLFRHYPGGVRAEGVVLGQRLSRRGKQTLVISFLSVPELTDCTGYWDAASIKNLRRVLEDVIFLGVRPSTSDWEMLTQKFSAFLPLPPQHDL